MSICIDFVLVFCTVPGYIDIDKRVWYNGCITSLKIDEYKNYHL